jgi:DeoR/GlpR family transcriptional regulator of sugar metabolism
VDAGSSTSFAIEQFLTSRSMPIQTSDGRLVRPTFITNSLEIADVVSRSDYPRDIPVRIIGGELRVEYGSICGPLTDICLSGWGGMGADVAIVGTTSYTHKFGIPSFGCDDISEGRVKV